MRTLISSLQGQAWIVGVRRCLMQSIINSDLYSTNGTTCKQLKDFAFNSHPNCYVSNGFCSDILVSTLCQNLVCLGAEVFVYRDFFNKQALDQVSQAIFLMRVMNNRLRQLQPCAILVFGVVLLHLYLMLQFV